MLVKWRNLDRIFDGFFSYDTPNDYTADYECDDDRATLRFDVPGVKKGDIGVHVEDDIVTVEGRRGEREFKHEYTIDRNYDASSVDAVLEDGVLTVQLPKGEQARARKIEIAA